MSTVAVETAPSGSIRRLLRVPIGKPFLVCVVAASLFTMWFFSSPAIDLMSYLAVAAIWMVLGGYWVLRLVAMAFAGGTRDVGVHWKRFAWPALAVCISAAMVFLGVPFQARFMASRQAMDDYARTVISGDLLERPSSPGLYQAKSVETFPGGMRFLVGECGVDMCGFAYSPHRLPPDIGGEDNYTHLDGPWYLWEESW